MPLLPRKKQSIAGITLAHNAVLLEQAAVLTKRIRVILPGHSAREPQCGITNHKRYSSTFAPSILCLPVFN